MYISYRAVNTLSVGYKNQSVNAKHINTLCGQNAEFLGVFSKLRKATSSFVMSVLFSARMEQLGSHWQIFMKFDIWVFFDNVSRKFKFH